MAAEAGFEVPERGCTVVRLDYGYPGVNARGRSVWDLGREPVPRGLGREAMGGRGALIRRADLLLGWAKTRAGAGIFRELQRFSERGGLVLECRFPRHARALVAGMTARREPPRLVEAPADGGLPPVYRTLDPESELCLHHLQYEWWTGMGVARGGVALLRVAFELAEAESRSPQDIAKALGVTGGAARSYLRWMEDAALVRKGAEGVSLRHPLLASLFARGERLAPPPPPPRSGRPRAWDVVELD